MENNDKRFSELIKMSDLESTSDDFTNNLLKKINLKKSNSYTYDFNFNKINKVIGLVFAINISLIYLFINLISNKFDTVTKELNSLSNLFKTLHFQYLGMIFIAMFLLLLIDNIAHKKYFKNH